MVAEHLLEGIVEKVGSRMVGCTRLTLVGIHTSHEFCLYVLWQSLHDMYRLVVLTFGVGDGDGLLLVYEDTGVAHLTSHLAIERSVVENELKVCVLLLRHLAVAQYVTFIFSIVVAHELLLARTNLNPVAVFHSCRIAGTLLLLLHLYVKLLLVYGDAALTTDKLGEVEWESVGVE